MKKEQDVCILAHAYQGQEILEVADYMGDSYGLSVQGAKSKCKGIIMCGVRFMAETCKVLSPEKKVWLANPSAGCPMAEQLDLEGLRKLKAEHPDHTVVVYINTTSELKTESYHFQSYCIFELQKKTSHKHHILFSARKSC